VTSNSNGATCQAVTITYNDFKSLVSSQGSVDIINADGTDNL